MANPKVRILIDILEEHFEELQFLWSQRQTALRSPRYTLRELSHLEDRIEAHVQGLLIAGEQIMALVEKGLSADDPVLAFAAAYALLRLNTEAASKRVLDSFRQAKGGQLDGVRQALCHVRIPALLPHLRQMLASLPPPVAVAVAEVLGFQRTLELTSEQWNRFFKQENAAIRQAAWRAARLAIPQAPATYQGALQDEDAAARREALLAAAWGRQPWLLEHCRKVAARPSPENGDAIQLLAILGKPPDLPAILAAGQAAELGPPRFRVLGAFGHPGAVEALLKGIESKDPLTAVAAGAAFRKITAVVIESDKRVQIPPQDGSKPDEFEKEFLDEVKLPSLELARSHWQKVKDRFSKGNRWCRGFDLSRDADPAVLAQLDLESRWEACLRGKCEGTWKGNPADLEVFPQRHV